MPAAQIQWIAGPDELFDGATRCVSDLHTSMTSADARDLADIFQTLSNPARVRLLALLLREAPGGDAPVGDIIGRLGWSQSTVSHHLRALTATGLVHRRSSGSQEWYSVDAGRLQLVLALLGESSPIRR